MSYPISCCSSASLEHVSLVLYTYYYYYIMQVLDRYSDAAVKRNQTQRSNKNNLFVFIVIIIVRGLMK